MRRFALLIIAVTLLTSSIAQAASYQMVTGTIVDPIQHLFGYPHTYSGNNLEPSANLSNADLYGAALSDANLTDANLTNTTLFQATLYDTVLTNANLTGAGLTGATLTGVTSGGIIGSPGVLPTNWQLTSRYLIGPGASLLGAALTSANLAGGPLWQWTTAAARQESQ